MNWKCFLTGIGLLITAFFQHQLIKGEEPASEKNNGEGMAPYRYFRYLVGIIICVLAGVALIYKSFTA